LHLIGLLDKPSEGKVYIDGHDTSNLSDEELSRFRGKKLGFVFQAYNLLNSFIAIENVMMPLLINDVKREEAEKRALYLLKRVGLEQKAYVNVNKLSGGQQQRVAIARALAMQPKIVLADEPTGNLDTKTGHEIIRIFDELNRGGITFVIVTHDPEIAEEADRIIYIRDGMIEKFKDGRKIKKVRQNGEI
jgi:putative ABC transport system ATP-binding protein